MANELRKTTGIVDKILPLDNKNPNYPKQFIVLKIDSSYKNKQGEMIIRDYPRKIVFENDKIDCISKCTIGDMVVVEWLMHGYEFEKDGNVITSNVDKGMSIIKHDGKYLNQNKEPAAFHAAPILDEVAVNTDAQFPEKKDNDLPF